MTDAARDAAFEALVRRAADHLEERKCHTCEEMAQVVFTAIGLAPGKVIVDEALVEALRPFAEASEVHVGDDMHSAHILMPLFAAQTLRRASEALAAYDAVAAKEGRS